ncbi:response regulator transcription factor [Paenibacillus cremeus]|uniref:Response regulator transcription factor n=1 Tax=Paenibacillus cremeus TaxID=2163881 RepID=A0A559K6E6_9BACL|nr:response regulator transcription factor [Paenibacillus cremeus]TVY07699.1 response regulator transcription factor [Paenibacillus cremeus]
MSGDRILLVEDDKEIRDLIRLYLTSSDYQVITAENGLEGLKQFELHNPDLVLLDIFLPEMDGFEVCQQIRSVSNVPIVFISCRKDSDDIVQGLALGGDDYITKPFDPVVVVARVRANLRRAPIFRRSQYEAGGTKPERSVVKYGSLEIDFIHYQVRLNGSIVLMSAKEMQLLMHLVRYPDQVFTAEEIYTRVWGEDSNSDTRTVLVHISSIRKKIESNPAIPQYIQNIRGIGYKFNSSY